MNLKSKKYWLIGLLWGAGLIDALTFYFGNIHQFEVNPIYVIYKSIALLMVFKFAVLSGLTYLVLKYQPKKRYVWAYTLIFMVVFGIIAQLFGGYLNITTKVAYEESGGTIQPMEKEQAIQTYSIYQILLLYLPMLLAVLSFAVFERIYLDGLVKRELE